jgi:N-acetylneuraminate synthase
MEFKIGNRIVGDNHPPVVIAEIGINHGGSLDIAIAMAEAAIAAGAEIIKHQTHIVDDEMSEEAKSVIPGNADKSIYEIMNQCALSENQERLLMEHINSKGSIFISTPFSKLAAERLGNFNIPAFKIGSGECANYHFVKFLTKYKKPIIMSTGMNSIESILPSVQILRSAKIPFALLHCTNIYPTPPSLVRLDAITLLKNHFPDAVVGLSDHTLTNDTCLGAVALGASILERHFTDSMERIGPDIICSMDPTALQNLISGAKIIFSAKGSDKNPLKEELPTIAFAKQSVVATKNLNIGDILSEENIWLKRPGNGDFSINDYDDLIGRKVQSPILCGSQIKKYMLEK